ncbi:hypothetical protein P171DRAFT_521442 [Karstenula rhodostoma CBS 690.94]|uniref:DNA-directed RNA polymerase I subunit RPA34.5-domain-containing protein n=1 Tax=Karstenula rhodostoma CBS 690.94 TaxID=1392251 RepID=A0A9P4PHC7_9PLEO|nr:hypothetical protein P171DRAFT_521442 [Karstenula rhodostoma CBS 690.94]
MSKPRKTPVPLPGSKTNTPISAPSSKKTPIPVLTSKSPKEKAQLSNELVGDSDDSSDEVADKPSDTQKKASINIAVHRPKTNGVAKPAPEAKKKQKDPPKKATKAAAASKKPAPKQVTTEEEGASSSDEESSDDAETDIKQAQQREAQKKQKEDSDSSSEDSSDESEEETAPAQQRADARTAHSQSQTVTFQQARPYVPPEDFKAASTERAAVSANTNLFKNLDGKQIWHITAPEGVSLKDLKKLAMDKVQKGEAVLDHKGTSYGLAPAEVGAGGREVMIPVVDGYKAVPTQVSHSFHVQQVVNLPKLTSKQADQNTGSEAAASITASTIRAVKPQVKGLKMRFFPSGFEDSAPTTLGDSDDEADAPAPAGLGVPVGFDPPARKEKKRKHEQSNAGEEAESSAKKHKKHRTAEEQQQREEKKAKKDKKKEKKSSS